MIPRLHMRLSFLLLAAVFSSQPIAAHELKESITRVLFNTRTGNIEVMHRFLLHDAEHAVQKLFGPGADLLANADDRGRFEEYVHERFSLMDQDGAAITLAPVGHEIEGSYLWVYSESPIPPDLSALSLSHVALHDVWQDQINRVNVERDKKTRSAAFEQDSPRATIRF